MYLSKPSIILVSMSLSIFLTSCNHTVKANEDIKLFKESAELGSRKSAFFDRAISIFDGEIEEIVINRVKKGTNAIFVNRQKGVVLGVDFYFDRRECSELEFSNCYGGFIQKLGSIHPQKSSLAELKTKNAKLYERLKSLLPFTAKEIYFSNRFILFTGPALTAPEYFSEMYIVNGDIEISLMVIAGYENIQTFNKTVLREINEEASLNNSRNELLMNLMLDNNDNAEINKGMVCALDLNSLTIRNIEGETEKAISCE